MKSVVLALAAAVSWIYRLIPARLRHGVLFGLFVLEGRSGDPKSGLRNLFTVWDKLDLAISERAMAYGGGQHPKHRLTDYHGFFTGNIAADARVLDIGCGYGAVAATIAADAPHRQVTGIDIDPANIAQARATNNLPNLTFVQADALAGLPDGPWDVVVLSNILEHIDARVDFLRTVIANARPHQVLIRVPLFERHWHLPLRAELGVSFVSDPDHKIEHRLADLHDEVTAAGLAIGDTQTLWGEIWCACTVPGARVPGARVPGARVPDAASRAV